MNNRISKTITFSALLFIATNTFAASGSQAGKEPEFFEAEEIAAFAKQVEKKLAQKGARVFIIARQGKPTKELPKGIHYTHTGFGVYSNITKEDGTVVPGYAMYNLYQKADEPDASFLEVDYPIEYFAGVNVLKAGIIIPKPELQKRLLDIITSDTYSALHNPKYSVISNPFNAKYQNCTEHTLDVINAAIYKTTNIEKIKKNTKAYYRPQKISVGPIKLLLGGLFARDVFLTDHSGPIATSTFTTIQRYLQEYDLVDHVMTLMPENDHN